ncbi:MAG TPA: tetratricopeptide repeat protein [Burkholderiales bacterium]|nr:tetratricopeptide repeat protein [Burkholderiales bacterium]
MTSRQIDDLLKLVGTPRDGALLRFSLGNECLKSADFEAAAAHLMVAVEKDPGYSAAWKLLGNALAQGGRAEEALTAYRKGIQVAEDRGDRQAAKEMAVFARRVEKALTSKDKPGVRS